MLPSNSFQASTPSSVWQIPKTGTTQGPSFNFGNSTTFNIPNAASPAPLFTIGAPPSPKLSAPPTPIFQNVNQPVSQGHKIPINFNFSNASNQSGSQSSAFQNTQYSPQTPQLQQYPQYSTPTPQQQQYPQCSTPTPQQQQYPQYSTPRPQQQQHVINQYHPSQGPQNRPSVCPAVQSPQYQNSAIIDVSQGRGPSIFSPDPEFRSSLYTWGVSPSTGKSYAIGLNTSLTTDLSKPPGYMSLPSSRNISTDESNFLDRTSQSSSSFLLASPFLHSTPKKQPNESFNWRSILDKNVNEARAERTINYLPTCLPKPSPPRPLPGFRRPFNIENDDLSDGSVDVLPKGTIWKRRPNKKAKSTVKTLDPWIVAQLENPEVKANRFGFDNPGPRLGPRSGVHGDHNTNSNQIPRIVGSYLHRQGPKAHQLIGFFNQPFENDNSSAFDSQKQKGPPKTNSDEGGPTDFQRVCNVCKAPEPAVGNLPKDLPSPSSNSLQRRRVRLIREEMPPTLSSNFKEASADSGEYFCNCEPQKAKDPNLDQVPKVEETKPLVILKRPPLHSPSRVKLLRPQYYCVPDVATLDLIVTSDGHCLVDNFEVGHLNYGKVVFPGCVNVAGFNLDEIINFKHKEFEIYPNDSKPPYGEGLNRKAIVTLINVWPLDKTIGKAITNKDQVIAMNYESLLRRSCKRFEGNFINYDADNGFWNFEIQLQ